MNKVLEKIAHIIIPHEKNKNVPHLLQRKFVGLLSILVIALFFFNQNNFEIIRGLNLTAAIYPAVLADLTNEDRAEKGIPSLTWSGVLENAARMKAEDMVRNGYFAHTSPLGITPWHWFREANYNFVYAGENLAIDFTESANVQRAWLNSPTHRANVLSYNFTEMGIMAVEGEFEGRNTTFVVELFGKPAEFFKVAEASTNTTISENTAPETKTTTEPEVAGTSAESVEVEKPKAQIPVKIIAETDEITEKFISVENLETTKEVPEGTNLSSNKPLSTWYMRLVVNPTNAIKTAYGILLILVFLAMSMLLSVEYQRHHTRHLVMGLTLVAIIGVSLYFLNSPMIVEAFF